MLDLSLQQSGRTTPATVGARLDLAILQGLSYADLFDYPLRAAEVQHALVGVRATETEVGTRLAALARSGELARREGYYTLPGREGLVEIRRRRERAATELWPEAVRCGRVIADLPYVRMVAVTGSLAVRNVESPADIDYMVVTAPGRVWVVRGTVSLYRRVAMGRGVRLCPNYVLSEEALVIEDRNLYTAHELLQMVPISGREVYLRMLAVNDWTARFLPNHPKARLDGLPADARKRLASRAAEAVLDTPLGPLLDRLERARLTRKMIRRGGDPAEATYSPDCCKDHVHSHGQRILRAYAQRARAAASAAGVYL